MKKKILCAAVAAMMFLIPIANKNTFKASAVLKPGDEGWDDRIDDELYTKTDEYWYYINSEGTATIARYVGAEKDVIIPSEIDGYPVTVVRGYVEYRDSLTTGTFEGLDIKSLVIPDSVKEVEPGICEQCNELEKLVIGNSVEEIIFASFTCLPNLKEVKIGSSVTKIGTQAFDYCPDLKEITIPATVEEIGWCAFGYSIEDNDWHEKVDPDFTIYCYSGTAGEEYAISNGINYVLLDAPKPDDSSSIPDDNSSSSKPDSSSKTDSSSSGREESSSSQPDDSSISDDTSSENDNSSSKPDSSSSKPEDSSSKPENKPLSITGDVNGDGVINVTDITKLAAHVKGIKALEADELLRADVNDDKTINITDISMLAAHVKGIKPLK